MQNERLIKLINDCLGPETGKQWPYKPLFWTCFVWVMVDINRAITYL